MLLFLDISGGELLVIMIAAFLVFGPKRMPEIARKLGKGLSGLRETTRDLTREIREDTALASQELEQCKDAILSETRQFSQEMVSGPTELPEDLLSNASKPHPGNDNPPSETHLTGLNSEKTDNPR